MQVAIGQGSEGGRGGSEKSEGGGLPGQVRTCQLGRLQGKKSGEMKDVN